MECGFTLRHYREILTQWKSADRQFRLFTDPPTSEPSVILRHDVDFDPAPAVALGEIEADLGLRSTYFFRIAAEQYNALAPAGIDVIARLAGQGHEVGLHFDPSLADDRDRRLRQECETFETYTGISVRVFSVHRPPEDALRWQPDGLLNAYAAELMMPVTRYISDSNMHWREGCACNHTDPSGWGTSRTLQVLFHPGWWAETDGDSVSRIGNFLSHHMRLLDAEAAREVRSYGEYRRQHPLV